MAFIGLTAKRGLDAADVFQVQALADAVRHTDGVELKLNLPRQVRCEQRASTASEPFSELCYYDAGQLVGYAPLDGDDDELEITAAVMPSHRKQGIFQMLLETARREALRRGVSRLLLVSYPASRSGTAAIHALGVPYILSEYRLEVKATDLPPLDSQQIHLVPVNETNVTELAQLTARSFGSPAMSLAALKAEIAVPRKQYFLAEREGEYIGQIGVVNAGQSLYIRGVGIVPEQRRCGYGRQLLAATLQAMLAKNYEHFALDVAVNNKHALRLYEACGFRETEAYDYYQVAFTGSEI
jgi:ribosomal protein S18 acetylase RimI-like enzyme